MVDCNLCFECVKGCPRGLIGFRFGHPFSLHPGNGQITDERVAVSGLLSRRAFLGASISGLFLPSVDRVAVAAKNPDPFLIRPPGALAEKEFKVRCVRCAECVQVCIGNALQPALLQAGVDGIFTPVLTARIGYCEFNCTLCGQVCPSGAIRVLEKKEKQALKIGHAWFDTDLCLPYAKGIPCMVCEEHCPTPEKAIRFREVEFYNDFAEKIIVKQPYVVDDLCIGCGICETKCPLPGRAAIYVTSAGEERHPERALPQNSANRYY